MSKSDAIDRWIVLHSPGYFYDRSHRVEHAKLLIAALAVAVPQHLLRGTEYTSMWVSMAATALDEEGRM